jgi:vancomycin resistance protein YoaR
VTRQYFTLLIILILSLFIPGCSLLKPAPKPLTLTAPEITIAGQPVGGLTQAEVIDLLLTLAPTYNLLPQNAGFDPNTGEITPEKAGRYLDIAATVDAATKAPAGTAVPLVFGVSSPSVTATVLKHAQLLSAFTTKIIDSHPARVHNIRLAANLINNTLIEPGYEFSFNKRVGEPTAERGFEPARIFGAAGQVEDGLGGGICQVSSTLYNAALGAGLTITERHPHSQPVAYVPLGKDATTYTDKDLRFINSTRCPIIIRSIVTTHELLVNILGLPTR